MNLTVANRKAYDTTLATERKTLRERDRQRERERERDNETLSLVMSPNIKNGFIYL